MATYVAVWIDYREAHVLQIVPDASAEAIVVTPQHVHHRHGKGQIAGKGQPEDTRHFFQEVARSLKGAEGALVVGPSMAKLEFIRYLDRHGHAPEAKVIGIETVDHPADGKLMEYARQYFKAGDRPGAAAPAPR
jgi:stalled ribosome rescue protein Dom34